MASVIFCGFGKDLDKRVKDVKNGEILLRVASANGIELSGDKIVKVEELTDEKQTTYMEDVEVDKLIKLGLLTAEKAEELNQSTTQSEYRLADLCLVKGDILVKPYN
jgi:hypothetical protein